MRIGANVAIIALSQLHSAGAFFNKVPKLLMVSEKTDSHIARRGPFHVTNDNPDDFPLVESDASSDTHGTSAPPPPPHAGGNSSEVDGVCRAAPTKIPHAKLFKSKCYKNRGKTICKNAVFSPLNAMDNPKCMVECEHGYTLASNTIMCEERDEGVAAVAGTAICAPVSCGVPMPLAHATHSPKCEVDFPNVVVYHCETGYTLDGTGTGLATQTVKCLGNGDFEDVKPCVPVHCGHCPEHEHSSILTEGGKFFTDECVYKCECGYTKAMKKYTTICLPSGLFSDHTECEPVVCDTPIVTINFALSATHTGGHTTTYPNSIPYTCSPGFSLNGVASGPKDFDVHCLASGEFSEPEVCSPVHCVEPGVVEHSTRSRHGLFVYGDALTFTCTTGYETSDVTTLTCMADGNFNFHPPTCSPVPCGTPIRFPNSELLTEVTGPIDYESHALLYKCDAGYSTVKNDNIWLPKNNYFLVSCQANGLFTMPDMCVNINDCAIRCCGPHGDCVDSHTPTGVPIDDYHCDCHTGFEVTLHPSTNAPAGFPDAKMKRCTDINDCPEGACGGVNHFGLTRGTCHDKINDYNCCCAYGYENIVVGGNETCVPIDCGMILPIDHAHPTPEVVGHGATYDSVPWTFTCDTGFSLNGQPGGPQTFAQYCLPTGNLTTPQTCLPTTCGPPKSIINAEKDTCPAELFFLDLITYTCDTGYSLHGEKDGITTFEAHCLSSGDIVYQQIGGAALPGLAPIIGGQDGDKPAESCEAPLPRCDPIMCGVVPVQENARYMKHKELRYPEALRIQCLPGFSVDGNACYNSSRYYVYCEADGSFNSHGKWCKPVTCPKPPVVEHSSRVPMGHDFIFGDIISYTMDPGYHIDFPGVDKINGTWTCKCGADGKWDGVCAEDTDVKPIKCPPITVEHGTVTGIPLFGETLIAVADTGYTLDGEAVGGQSFEFSCEAHGGYEGVEDFERIKCGHTPDIAHVEHVVFTKYDEHSALMELSAASKSGKELVEFNRRSISKTSSVYFAYYLDVVTYHCQKGFRAASLSSVLKYPIDPILPEAPTDFSLICATTGDFDELLAGGGTSPHVDKACLPVTCDVMKAAPTDPEVPALGAETMRRIVFKDRFRYMCKPGYSLDGTPTGSRSFTKKCTAKGVMRSKQSCKPINYCINNLCGAYGTCVDELLGYICNCQPGYKVGYIGCKQTCVEINECLTQNGEHKCSPGGGKCLDKVGRYECQCTEGYIVVKDSHGHETCQPVSCGPLPPKPNAHSTMELSKLVFSDDATYSCDIGHTTTGSCDGSCRFNVECGADGVYTNMDKHCFPVECGHAPHVTNAELPGPNVYGYGEEVATRCLPGFRTPSGEREFTTTCLAACRFSTPKTCNPVVCGVPPAAINAMPETNDPILFTSPTVTYHCAPGYVVSDDESATSFEVHCTPCGSFVGLKSCKPVSCGSPMYIPNTLGVYFSTEYFYGDSFVVDCGHGYKPAGATSACSSFTVVCLADGSFHGLDVCEPISCGIPPPSETATVDSDEKTYGEFALYTCKKGYSLSGLPEGTKMYYRECAADGTFTNGGKECIDIDFCVDNPCTDNGECVDLGPGVTNPGYQCHCFHGYEPKVTGCGRIICAADDCAGDPCGEGDCTDLSIIGGAPGAYACICPPGYTNGLNAEGKETCLRVVCDPLPTLVNNTSSYNVDTRFDNEPRINAHGTEVSLEAFDQIMYTCAPGFSVDGTLNPDSKTFLVRCGITGTLSRPRTMLHMACVPITCDSCYIGTPPHSSLISSGPYTYGGSALFKCDEGYSLDGTLHGPTELHSYCLATGYFGPPDGCCHPIACGPLSDVHNSTLMGVASLPLHYGETATYLCDHGYHVHGSTTVHAECQADGTIEYTVPGSTHSCPISHCEPVTCGAVPAQPGATLGMYDGSLSYGESVIAICYPGWYLGGKMENPSWYEISCASVGLMLGDLSKASASDVCSPEKVTITGVIYDSRNVTMFLDSATVHLTHGNGTVIDTILTGASGIYSAEVFKGAVSVTASKHGYTTRSKSFVASGPISVGSVADVALPLILGPDHWEVIMTWGENPQDLDAVVHFGCGLSKTVSFSNRADTSSSAGGLEVSLNKDVTNGFGPEIVSLDYAGLCDTPGCCLVRFEAVSPAPGVVINDFAAKVEVYKGGSKVAEFTNPECLSPDGKVWPVFTIDASSGVNQILSGPHALPPYVFPGSMETISLAGAFDAPGWVYMPTDGSGKLPLMAAMQLDNTKEIQAMSAAGVYYVDGGAGPANHTCIEIPFNDFGVGDAWFACPPGHFLSGFRTWADATDAIPATYEKMTGFVCCKHDQAPFAFGCCEEIDLESGSFNECPQDDCGSNSPRLLTGLKTEKRGVAINPMNYTGPLARHTTSSDGVYIGNNFIQVGARSNDQIGKLGTSSNPPAGWYTRQYGVGVGMLANAAGFDSGPERNIEYFLPGNPIEGWYAGYKEDGTAMKCMNSGTSVSDTTIGGAVASMTTRATCGDLSLSIKQSIQVGQKFFMTEVEVKNSGTKTLTQVRFMRSHDPDNTVDAGGEFTTINKVEMPTADITAMVSARSKGGDAYFNIAGEAAIVMYLTSDERAKVSIGDAGLFPTHVFDPQVYDSPKSPGFTNTKDTWISMTFEEPSMVCGATTTFKFVTALDACPVSDIVDVVTKEVVEKAHLVKAKCCSMKRADPIDICNDSCYSGYTSP